MKLTINVKKGTLGRRKYDSEDNTLIEIVNLESGKGWVIAEVNGEGEMRLFQKTIDTQTLE